MPYHSSISRSFSDINILFLIVNQSLDVISCHVRIGDRIEEAGLAVLHHGVCAAYSTCHHRNADKLRLTHRVWAVLHV